MSVYRRFNLGLLTAILPSLLAVGLFNIAIDPYGVINSPDILGLNRLRTQKFSNVRLFKAIDVARLEPKTLLMGSSRTDLGLDPTHPALANKQPAYNLALVGPNMYEVKRYFEHALKNQTQLRTVIIGIDLFMFNEFKENGADFDEARLEKESLTLQELLNVALSSSAFQSSIRTIQSSLNFNAYYLYHPNGQRYVYRNQPNEPLTKKFEGSIRGLINSEQYYKNYELSKYFLDDLRDIIETCKQRNIDLKIFISPSHASLWEAMRITGLWPVFEEWKREVVKITPVWDFSGFNSITTEPINEEMTNYWDSSHYRKEVGDLILNRLFDYQNKTIPVDFGVLLTRSNIEAQLAGIRADHETWANENPDAIKFVKDLF